MLPDIDTREKSIWMGCRPSLPDSLPVLGFSRRSNRVVYAFGHQHLGMTLGAVSGQVIADLVAGRESTIDVTPYCPTRF
jgi:glycine/D-amino acid oxidase-like deaminating enzyme